ncbi:MAG: thiamine-phosphate kinase [Thermoguttaceae bacterium]|nr:thiamine-phosphate kinase [Thermoguttaceae bacterium]
MENLTEQAEARIVEQAEMLMGPSRKVPVGIGDDAAVLDCEHTNMIATVDMLTDGVDFLVGSVDPQWIGRKSLAVNLSDLAAMGALPHSVLVAVALPRSGGMPLAQGILQGMRPLLQQYEVALAGGDTNAWDGPLVVSVTAFGLVNAQGVLLRSKAQAGDRIVVTGRLGGTLPRRQFTFQPRISQARFLLENNWIHAAMDISDGLLLDLSRMAKASSLGFILYDEAVPIHDDALACCRLVQKARELLACGVIPENLPNVRFPFDPNESVEIDELFARAKLLDGNFNAGSSKPKTPLDRALTDGEDFELILAVDSDRVESLLQLQPFAEHGVELTEIGQWRPPEEGYKRRTLDGKLVDCDTGGGFLHRFD